MKSYPQMFLDVKYLRYVGWSLSDTNASVRLETVKSLLCIFSDSSINSGLANFTSRFKKRIVDMASMECDERVRLETVKVCVLIYQLGFMDPSDETFLSSRLIMDANLKISGLAGTICKGVLSEIYLDSLKVAIECKDDDASERKTEIKALLQLIVASCETVHEIETARELSDLSSRESPVLGEMIEVCVSESFAREKEAMEQEASDLRTWLEKEGTANKPPELEAIQIHYVQSACASMSQHVKSIGV